MIFNEDKIIHYAYWFVRFIYINPLTPTVAIRNDYLEIKCHVTDDVT